MNTIRSINRMTRFVVPRPLPLNTRYVSTKADTDPNVPTVTHGQRFSTEPDTEPRFWGFVMIVLFAIPTAFYVRRSAKILKQREGQGIAHTQTIIVGQH